MPLSEQVDADESEPTIWKCGEAYRYPIPEPNEDPWSTLLEPQLKEDRIRCEAWRDEVQTLLIFAGLFSAVVTAFAVQSYATLQEDPSLVLLHRLVESVEGLRANATAVSPRGPLPPLEFSTSGSPTRVNILWFLSLILSLTTVLCGIIALQWIREHQRYRNSVTKPKIALATFRMRSDALESWWISQLFTGLPLLLLASLVLFFVGMVDFLLSLNRTVASPVIVLIILTLLFVAVTTCLPTIQLLAISFFTSRRKPSIPSQCPYKSPQSWAFHQLTVWALKHVSAAYSFLLHSGPGCTWKLSSVSLQPLFTAEYIGSWIHFDIQWLNIRDAHFQNLQGLFSASSELVHPRRPKYDLTSAIIDIVEDHQTDYELLIAGYHCFNHISRSALLLDIENDVADNTRSSLIGNRNELLRRYYFRKPQFSSEFPMSILIKDPHPALLHDENMACFLWLFGLHISSSPKSNIVRNHIVELQSRILAHIFSEAPHVSSNHTVINQNPWSARICAQYLSLDNQRLRVWFTGSAPRLDKKIITDIVEQYFLMLHSFVKTAASTADEDIISTTHGKEIILLDFLRVPSLLHHYISTGAKRPDGDSAHGRILSIFQSTLSLIIATLDPPPKENGESNKNKNDFLFISSCILARNMTRLDISGSGSGSGSEDRNPEYANTTLSFFITLLQYEQDLDKERLLSLLEPLMPWSIHSFFDDERRRYIFTPLHQMTARVRDSVMGGITTSSRREVQSSEKHVSRRQLSNFLPIDCGSSQPPS